MAEKEYIEREALLKKAYELRGGSFAAGLIIEQIEKAPSADVVEVKHGEWKDTDWSGISVKGYMACSQCNVMIPTCDDNRYCLGYLYFCPNCGAKMC